MPTEAVTPTHSISPYSLQFYPAAERRYQTFAKRLFAVFNGIGWAATFVGGLTLTGIGTLGMGTPAIVALTAATLPTGTLFGFMYFNDQINADNKKEQELIENINKKLFARQIAQTKLLGYLLEADVALTSRLYTVASMLDPQYLQDAQILAEEDRRDNLLNKIANHPTEFTPEQKKAVTALAKLAHSIQSAAHTLLEIEVGEGKITLPKDGARQVKCAKVKADIIATRENCYWYAKFCAEPMIKKLLHKDQVSAIPSAKPISETPTTFTQFAKATYSSGNGVGLGFGIATIFCGIALASNPAGWMIAATLGAAGVISAVLGGVSYYLDQKVKAEQDKNLQKLTRLDQAINRNAEEQDKRRGFLKRDINLFKQSFVPKPNPAEFIRVPQSVTPTPIPRSSSSPCLHHLQKDSRDVVTPARADLTYAPANK